MGYSSEDAARILTKCPHSCLQCGRATSAAECHSECVGLTGNVACRERIRGLDVGSDGNFNPDTSAYTGLALVAATLLELQLRL